MKKICTRLAAGLTALLMALALASCGGDAGGKTSSTASKSAQKTYTIKYAGGEGASGTAPADVTAAEGDRLLVMKNTFSKEGHQFAGCSDGEKTYQEDEFFTVSKDMVLTAQWEEVGTKLSLLRTDALDERWQGFPDHTLKTADGQGYYEIAYDGDIVWMCAGANLNLSGYANQKGVLRISLYADKPQYIVGGQIELTSSGTADQDEFTFGEMGSRIKLNAGWNDLTLPLSSAAKVGNPDWSNIMYIRIYFNVDGGKLTAGIRDFYIDFPKEF